MGLKTNFDSLSEACGEQGLDQLVFSIALDSLFDSGIVRAAWEQSADGKYYRSLTISPDMRDMIRVLYDLRNEFGFKD